MRLLLPVHSLLVILLISIISHAQSRSRPVNTPPRPAPVVVAEDPIVLRDISCVGTMQVELYSTDKNAKRRKLSTSCGAYACNKDGKSCNTACKNVADCAPAYVCSLATKLCAPLVNRPAPTPVTEATPVQ